MLVEKLFPTKHGCDCLSRRVGKKERRKRENYGWIHSVILYNSRSKYSYQNLNLKGHLHSTTVEQSIVSNKDNHATVLYVNDWSKIAN